jgi:hypothetical protein
MKKSPITFSKAAASVMIGGTYRHYKNLLYKVIAIAHHSETLEELVVYQALYGEHGVWVRPLGLFIEEIELDGAKVSRFALVQD